MTLEEEGRSTHRSGTRCRRTSSVPTTSTTCWPPSPWASTSASTASRSVTRWRTTCPPTTARSWWRRAHNHLIVDAYNANPTSMAAALDNFSLIPADKKMAILGQMGELGEASLRSTSPLATCWQLRALTNVWLVGDEFARPRLPFRKFHDVEEVKAEPSRTIAPKASIFLSRAATATSSSSCPNCYNDYSFNSTLHHTRLCFSRVATLFCGCQSGKTFFSGIAFGLLLW